MRINYLPILFLVIQIFTLKISYAQLDSSEVYLVIDTIESLNDLPLERTKYIAGLNHIYLELYAPVLYPYIKEEFDKAENITSLDNKFKIYFLMEAIHYNLDNYEKGTILAYELLKIAEQTQDSSQFYKAYTSILCNEEHLGNKYAIVEYSLKAHKYAHVSTDLLAHSNIELSKSFFAIKDYDKAESHLRQGIQIALLDNNLTQITYGYTTMSEFLYETDNYDESLEYCYKADSMLMNHNFLDVSNDVLYNKVFYGLNYLKKNEFKKAAEYLEKALKVAEKAKNNQAISQIYEALSSLEEKKGNDKKSLALLKEKIKVDGEIFDKEASINMNNLKVAFELSKKNLEIEIVRKKETFAQKQIFYISILAIATGLAFIFLLLYSRSKLKTSRIQEELSEQKNKTNQIEIKQLESKVQLKNKELANLFLHQYEKAELLTNIIDNIDTSNALLTNELQEKLNNEEDWSNFKMHFDKVHEGFFLKLHELSHNLTAKDIKYCAYIRMNLSSKEIAIMLGISHRTVEGIRGRVRKKLGLDSKVDLVLYLMNI